MLTSDKRKLLQFYRLQLSAFLGAIYAHSMLILLLDSLF